jgi:hypothetical protein
VCLFEAERVGEREAFDRSIDAAAERRAEVLVSEGDGGCDGENAEENLTGDVMHAGLQVR